MIFSGKLVFPDPQHPPPGPPQRPRHQTITHLIHLQFSFPEQTIVGRQVEMFRTTVPETTVHENRELEFRENEIRFSEDFLIPPPAGDVMRPQ